MAREKKQLEIVPTTSDELNNLLEKEYQGKDLILTKDKNKYYIATSDGNCMDITQNNYERIRHILMHCQEYAKTNNEFRKEGFININKDLF